MTESLIVHVANRCTGWGLILSLDERLDLVLRGLIQRKEFYSHVLFLVVEPVSVSRAVGINV